MSAETDIDEPQATSGSVMPAASTAAQVHDARKPPDAKGWRWATTSASVSVRRLRWWKEALFVLVFYEIYSVVRNQFGSSGSAVHGHVSALAVSNAYQHAVDVIRIERWFGLFVEPNLQRWYLDLPYHGFIRFWNIYYASLHFVITIAAIVLLYRRAPHRYRLWRNVLGATTGLALIGFAAFILMPPRLLGDSSQYGACNAAYHLHCVHYGLVDSLDRYGGLWSFGSGTMAAISNQYAAMPSLHIGWSTWCTIVLLPMVRRVWLKALIVLYPIATLFCILVTANHYWIDAVGGLVTLAGGYAVGYLALQATMRWDARRPLSAVPDGAAQA